MIHYILDSSLPFGIKILRNRYRIIVEYSFLTVDVAIYSRRNSNFEIWLGHRAENPTPKKLTR